MVEKTARQSRIDPEHPRLSTVGGAKSHYAFSQASIFLFFLSPSVPPLLFALPYLGKHDYDTLCSARRFSIIRERASKVLRRWP